MLVKRLLLKILSITKINLNQYEEDKASDERRKKKVFPNVFILVLQRETGRANSRGTGEAESTLLSQLGPVQAQPKRVLPNDRAVLHGHRN